MKKKPKTLPVKAAHCWRSKPPGTGIFLAASDPAFVILVRQDGSKRSGHQALWKQLNKHLKKKNL